MTYEIVFLDNDILRNGLLQSDNRIRYSSSYNSLVVILATSNTTFWVDPYLYELVEHNQIIDEEDLKTYYNNLGIVPPRQYQYDENAKQVLFSSNMKSNYKDFEKSRVKSQPKEEFSDKIFKL